MKKIMVLNNMNSLDRNLGNNETTKNGEPSLKRVLEAMKHIVKSEEWEKMENEIKDLTNKEKQEVSNFINNKIKPELWELKENIFNKEKRNELLEKIKGMINELKKKIKDMKEKGDGNLENKNYVVASTQIALLKVIAQS